MFHPLLVDRLPTFTEFDTYNVGSYNVLKFNAGKNLKEQGSERGRGNHGKHYQDFWWCLLCYYLDHPLMFFGEFYQVQSRINGFSITYIPIGRRLREDRLAASGNGKYEMCVDYEIRPDRTEFLSG